MPYSVEYQGELAQAAQLLREAAALTQQPTLKAFLTTRADAFLSNDYYASEVAWMELDASVEPTIGPYEVYEDDWFNYKAAFEAFITVRDDAETQKLAKFSGELQGLENALPIDPKLRNPKLGALAPIRVVNSLFSSGDGNRGVQTAAYNLPNDERVTAEKGTKRVMLKNVQEAKFQRVLLPIAQVALAAKDRQNVAFDAFFTHILMHELMHGLGPHNITVDGKATTVRQALQVSSSAIEEAKADISGLWALQQLVDKGVLDKAMERTMYTTYLASMFRSIRFGTGRGPRQGHGAAAQPLPRHRRGGGEPGWHLRRRRRRRSRSPSPRSRSSSWSSRAAATGPRPRRCSRSRAWCAPRCSKVLDKLKNVPVDIEPRFVTADQLVRELGGPEAPKK